jgi:hypothetical protein
MMKGVLNRFQWVLLPGSRILFCDDLFGPIISYPLGKATP